MKFSAQRETLLAPLQHVVGAVERRQATPILGNVLMQADDGYLTLTASDSEIEMQARVEMHIDRPGSTTVPARKLLEICKHLPDSARVDFDYFRVLMNWILHNESCYLRKCYTVVLRTLHFQWLSRMYVFI